MFTIWLRKHFLMAFMYPLNKHFGLKWRTVHYDTKLSINLLWNPYIGWVELLIRETAAKSNLIIKMMHLWWKGNWKPRKYYHAQLLNFLQNDRAKLIKIYYPCTLIFVSYDCQHTVNGNGESKMAHASALFQQNKRKKSIIVLSNSRIKESRFEKNSSTEIYIKSSQNDF